MLELIGHLFSKGKGADLVLGLRVATKHCKARRTVHGGILATLADGALGYTLANATTTPQNLVTTNLMLD